MRELSLNVLDIAQNSISAGASLITLSVNEDTAENRLTLTITDNGRGMTSEQLERVKDPFYTTRTTRKVGMGIPLFRMAAEMAGGDLTIQSQLGVGTTVTANFELRHIDRMPLGDMNGTVSTLIRLNPELDFLYRYTVDGTVYELDTRELRVVLDGVSLSEPDVMTWIDAHMEEGILPLNPQA